MDPNLIRTAVEGARTADILGSGVVDPDRALSTERMTPAEARAIVASLRASGNEPGSIRRALSSLEESRGILPRELTYLRQALNQSIATDEAAEPMRRTGTGAPVLGQEAAVPPSGRHMSMPGYANALAEYQARRSELMAIVNTAMQNSDAPGASEWLSRAVVMINALDRAMTAVNGTADASEMTRALEHTDFRSGSGPGLTSLCGDARILIDRARAEAARRQ
jgi:hypothetical protein